MKYEQDRKQRTRTAEKGGKLISRGTLLHEALWKNKIIHKTLTDAQGISAIGFH